MVLISVGSKREIFLKLRVEYLTHYYNNPYYFDYKAKKFVVLFVKIHHIILLVSWSNTNITSLKSD